MTSVTINNYSSIKIVNQKIMKNRELVILGLALLPLVVLGIFWNSLPEQVPMHWNAEGKIDRMGDKIELALLMTIIPLFLYFLLRFIPKIDPKRNLDSNDKNYFNLRLVLQIFISGLFTFILVMTKYPESTDSNLILAFIGLGFSGLGYTFKNIKPNYFAGFRTPWTLENPEVWVKTHQMAAKYWMIGGVLIFISYFIFPQTIFIFLGITAIITLVPLVYSYIIFKKLTK